MQQQKPTGAKNPLGLTILKILFVGIILIVGAVILFGFVFPDFDPVNFIVNLGVLLLMLFLLGMAVLGIASFFKPKPFSPSEDFRNSIIRIAKKAKPFNAHNLFLRGEDMRTNAKWGKITGLGFMPYVVPKPVRDSTGRPIYETNEKGKIIYEKVWSETEKNYLKVPKQKYDLLTEKDGDVIFITEKFGFPLSMFFRGVDIIRANKKYVSDLIGDIYIKDVNLVPFGEYLYPAKQWQEDITRIKKQHEMDTIITTFRYNLDLISQVTQMSLGSDPTFQKIMGAQSERLTTNPSFAQGG